MLKKIANQVLNFFSNQKNVWFVIGCIVVLAMLIRIFNLPAQRLTHDEMSHGYNAYSILKTGKDEWGRSFPLVFQAFGDYKLPLYIYSSVPFIAIFGLNSYGIKMVSLLAGVAVLLGCVVLAGKIAQKISATKHKPLFTSLTMIATALVTAFSLWPIHLSRMALEAHLALALVVWSLVLLVSATEKKHPAFLPVILAGGLFGLSWYSYIAYRLIGFLLAIILAAVAFKKTSIRKTIGIFIGSMMITVLPLLPSLLGTAGTARFNQVSVLTDPGGEIYVQNQRNWCFLVHPLLRYPCALVFTAPFYQLKTISKNYLQHFSPDFLFFHGDNSRYLLSNGVSGFSMILLPFFLLGLIEFFKLKTQSLGLIIAAFMLLAPIPAALVESPQMIRSSAILPGVVILIGLGIAASITFLAQSKLSIAAKTLFIGAGIGLISFSTLQQLIDYTFIYPVRDQDAFYGVGPELVSTIWPQRDWYQRIYVSDYFPDVHILFATTIPIDPNEYQQTVVRSEPDEFGFQHPTSLGKLEFGSKTARTFICDETITSMLYAGKPETELPGSRYLFDFSGVHRQVQLIDIAVTRSELKAATPSAETGRITFTSFCQ